MGGLNLYAYAGNNPVKYVDLSGYRKCKKSKEGAVQGMESPVKEAVMMQIDETSVILPMPSNDRIDWFEKTYRIVLPIEYKDFLRIYNGAKPITNILNFNGREYVVERFLCLLDKPKENKIYGWYDLTCVLTQLDCRLIDDEDLVGMNVIPIAGLFAGDFICLDYRDNVNPCIIIWNHEESDDFEPVTEKVAENINEFFSMLSKQ